MDKTSSVIAAFQAGKFPTQKQTSAFIDNLLASDLITVDSIAGSPQLTKQGKRVAGDLRELLSAYKDVGEDKNGDDVLQEIFWHFAQADLSNTSLGGPNNTADARKLGASLRTALSVLWSNSTREGTSLFHDFASFSRLTLADAAELIEQGAGAAKESLRQTESEVQAGERNPGTGSKKRPAAEDPEDADARVKFEKTMDQAKVAGSKVIGVGQQASTSAQQTADHASSRMTDAYYKVCERAQKDPEYNDAISTVFDLVQKWLNKTLDTAADVNQGTDLDTFIDDPTPEKHVHQALRAARTLAERLSGGKSLDDLFANVRAVAADIRSDPDTKAWFDDFFTYTSKSLREPGYIRSDESVAKGKELRKRWQQLLDADSDVGRKWKKDVEAFQLEFNEFQDRAANEPGLTRLRDAQAKFGEDLAGAIGSGAQAGLQSLAESGWVFQDLLNVYVPRLINLGKGIPIPRTEYKDADIEFVLENVDIETLKVFPGHLYVRNITDIDITAPETGEANTAVGSMTHIHAKGVQISLKDVSFYYRDKSSTVGPEELTGLLQLVLPPQGLDIDIKVRLLPNTPKGLEERERIKGFHKVEKVEVNVSDQLDINITESNHSVLVTVFKPIMLAGLRRVLAKTLSEQIEAAITFADGVAWDIGERAVIFEDTGLPRSASLTAAVWSEIGRFTRGQSKRGLSTGWQISATGISKEDPSGVSFAMGAEPQILSPEQHGPKATFAEPAKNKIQRAADDAGMDVDVDDAAEGAKDVAAQAKGVVQEGIEKVKGFKATIDRKKEAELKSPGWKSSAFDS